MNKDVTVNMTFTPAPVNVILDYELVRATLRRVQDMLLTHRINGGERKLEMDQVCRRVYDDHGAACGTAACIGGWCGILLTGHDTGAALCMAKMVELDRRVRGIYYIEDGDRKDRLYNLFYDFNGTKNYDSPRVAATAIERYLRNKNPWPAGKMPDLLRYRRKPA